MQSVKLPDLPIPTCDASVVIVNDHIYVCGGVFACADDLARTVQVYDVSHRMWGTLPLSPQYYSRGVAINNKLVLIGGREAASRRITNLVSTWTGHGWQQDLPPMPTKRSRLGVTTYHTFVVVAGGLGEDEQTLLSCINVLNITTCQWWTPANLKLPRPMYGMQFTISSAHLCVASAGIGYDAATKRGTTSSDVWQLPVTALENILTNGDNSTPHQWTKVAPTPYYNSAILQDTAHIVAVGGDDESDQPTSDVLVYNPDSDEWSKVGQLSVPRARCAVVSLSRTSFIVCGGCTDARDPHNTPLTSVEVVHVWLSTFTSLLSVVTIIAAACLVLILLRVVCAWFNLSHLYILYNFMICPLTFLYMYSLAHMCVVSLDKFLKL